MQTEVKTAKPRILVVDDEAILALSTAKDLERAGFEVVATARSVTRALAVIAQVACDAAVLDVHLGKETSEPIAQELKFRGVPFVVVSGYSRSQIPPSMDDAPMLSKPIKVAALVAALNDSLSVSRLRSS